MRLTAGTLALLLATAAPAAPAEPRVLRAVRAQGEIRVDGRLDEPAWLAVEPAEGFLQRDPDQGRPASERTELRLLFDDEALYAGVRLHDSARGERVAAALAARRACRRPTASRSTSTRSTTAAPGCCSR